MLPQLVCLTQAAKNMGISYSQHDPNGNLISVYVGGKWYLFQKNYTPFNSETAGNICLDKEHTYHLLHEVVRMPRTLGFFDYQQGPEYAQYKHQGALEGMLREIDGAFRYPVVIKRNRGALAKHVYLAQDRAQAEEALKSIFNPEQKGYDFVALAQEYVPAKREFRAVFFREKLVLTYERFAGDTAFKAAYWNLPEGKSIHVGQPDLLADIAAFLAPMFEVLPLGWVGADLILDVHGDLHLIELNSGPRFSHFIRYNGEDVVTRMYEDMLQQLM